MRKNNRYVHTFDGTNAETYWALRYFMIRKMTSCSGLLVFPNRIILTTQTFPRKKYLVRRGWTNHESMEILMTNSWSEFLFKNRDKKETHKNWHFIIFCLSIMSRIVFPILLANLKSGTVDCFLFYRSSIKNITNWKNSDHFAFSILLDLTMVLDVWWSELIILEILIRNSREVNSF